MDAILSRHNRHSKGLAPPARPSRHSQEWEKEVTSFDIGAAAGSGSVPEYPLVIWECRRDEKTHSEHQIGRFEGIQTRSMTEANMYVEYDEEVDAAFVWLVDDIETRKQEVVREVWPDEFGESIGLLLSAEGRLMGIEVQPASERLPSELLARPGKLE
ncbi:MAG: DUF2283 domain-containing protein [Thioalkalivibrio sp.]|nr:DUF2283 domain-containing protein [Thioalkalivibrio sp.]